MAPGRRGMGVDDPWRQGQLVLAELAGRRFRSCRFHELVDAAFTQGLWTRLVLMVPVGLPLLYFLGGLVAHVGIALTGGAPRSMGATMGAVGYALAPALLAIAVLDVPLYLARVPGRAYLGFLGAVTFAFLVIAGITLARTHQMSVARGFLVAL